MRDFSQNHRWLSINTATVRRHLGQEQSLTAILDACASRGIQAVSPWRDQVAAVGLSTISAQVKALGLELSGYCRGGMFPAIDPAGLDAGLDDNRRAVDEARQAKHLVWSWWSVLCLARWPAKPCTKTLP